MAVPASASAASLPAAPAVEPTEGGQPTLDSLAKGASATIVEVRARAGVAMAEHVERLMELGFLPGASVRVIARGFPSGDPLAVRIGKATFALRRFEAECIHISAPRASQS